MSVSLGNVPLRTILVVDDDAVVRRYLEAQLSRLGCRLAFACDGEEALVRLAEDRPDLVLLDIMMPGIDGFEVCRRIKGDLATRDIPVIHFTSLGQEAKEASFEAGADDFLNKPLNIVELRSRVRSHLLIQSLRDELKATQGSHPGWRWEEQPRAKILAVVSDVDLREWVVDKLRTQGHDVLWARSLRGCLDSLAQGLPDLLVIDHRLEDGAASDFVGHLRNYVKSRDLPVLMLCSREAMERKQVAPEAGPIDYLVVPSNGTELRVRTDVLLREGRLLQGRSADRIGLERDLLVDPATGAYSEAFLEAHLTLMQGLVAKSTEPLSLLGAGCYQRVSGWLEAKDLVVRAARTLSAGLAPGEALCRVADRTFVLLLPGTDVKGLERRILALRQGGFEGALAGLPVTPGTSGGAVLRTLAQALREGVGAGGAS
ncbi:MAG TPA: response regulator [Holophaga sp.]|nr:response regulator [Holophaga sp.]